MWYPCMCLLKMFSLLHFAIAVGHAGPMAMRELTSQAGFAKPPIGDPQTSQELTKTAAWDIETGKIPQEEEPRETSPGVFWEILRTGVWRLWVVLALFTTCMSSSSSLLHCQYLSVNPSLSSRRRRCSELCLYSNIFVYPAASDCCGRRHFF